MREWWIVNHNGSNETPSESAYQFDPKDDRSIHVIEKSEYDRLKQSYEDRGHAMWKAGDTVRSLYQGSEVTKRIQKLQLHVSDLEAILQTIAYGLLPNGDIVDGSVCDFINIKLTLIKNKYLTPSWGTARLKFRRQNAIEKIWFQKSVRIKCQSRNEGWQTPKTGCCNCVCD